MSDCYDPETRSRVMSRIRSSGTQPELILGRLLERWVGASEIERHPTHIFGRPDFYLRSWRLAIFVDGCFFHACPLHYRSPAERAEYWEPKIARNRRRDQLVNLTLASQSIRVLRIWEHELKGKKIVGRERIRRRLRRAQAKCVPVEQPLAIVAESRAGYQLPKEPH